MGASKKLFEQLDRSEYKDEQALYNLYNIPSSPEIVTEIEESEQEKESDNEPTNRTYWLMDTSRNIIL